MYFIGLTDNLIYQYTLATAFDISTASYDSKSFNLDAVSTNPTATLRFSLYGEKIYTLIVAEDIIYQYSLDYIKGISWEDK